MQSRLTGKRNHIWSRDPAIDRTAPSYEAAVKKANEEGVLDGLPLKDGRRPMVWHLLSLSERAFSELTRTSLHELQKAMAAQGLGGALLDRGTYLEARDAARRALVGVENALDEEGRPFAFVADDFEESPGGKVLTAATIDRLYRRWGWRLIEDIGRRVIDLCDLDPT